MRHNYYKTTGTVPVQINEKRLDCVEVVMLHAHDMILIFTYLAVRSLLVSVNLTFTDHVVYVSADRLDDFLDIADLLDILIVPDTALNKQG